MRPFVFVNIAASLDGKISDEKRRQVRISCSEDLVRVDKLRASCDAIMVGIGTVIADDPRLTVKDKNLREKRVKEGKPPNPFRVIVDSKCRIPLGSKVLNREAKTVIAVSRKAEKSRIEEVSKHAEVVVCGEDRVDLIELLNKLYEIGVRRLMVEGGGTLVSSLISLNLVDEMYVYYAPIFIGGATSPTICDGRSFREPIRVSIECVTKLGEGILVKIKF